MADRHPDHDLLAELEPVAEQLLTGMSIHGVAARRYIPWRLGRDFDLSPGPPTSPG